MSPHERRVRKGDLFTKPMIHRFSANGLISSQRQHCGHFLGPFSGAIFWTEIGPGESTSCIEGHRGIVCDIDPDVNVGGTTIVPDKCRSFQTPVVPDLVIAQVV